MEATANNFSGAYDHGADRGIGARQTLAATGQTQGLAHPLLVV
jgi:hypothetical protein